MPSLNLQLMITTAKARYATTVVKPRPPQPGPPSLGRGGAPLSRAPQLVPSGSDPNRGALIEPLCKAVCAAHDQWRQQASFRDVKINGPIATGGRLQGPDLAPLIRANLGAAGTGSAKKYGDAVAAGLGEAWTEFQATFTVPGLPWYPSFVAVPAPMAPPTPNVPTPLSTCAHNPSLVSASALKARMDRKLSGSDPDDARLLQAIAEGFQLAVTQWLPTQQVMNVLGTGSVPTFAPPYVPVGPVVMGDNVPTPGHLLA
jgi:hypothetical protein